MTSIDPALGDWLCPNPGCGNWNWAKRFECNRCSTARPGSAQRRGFTSDRRPFQSDGHVIPIIGRSAEGGAARAARPPPSNIDPSVGDWMCGACGNWNWARRNECNKCFASHPTRAAPVVSRTDARLNAAAGLDVRGYSTADRGAKRNGEGGGFREFDDEEDARRKRRAYEERMEKAERKAERKKCDFCKRFACIC
mmetsp:Transcript_26706/g.56110  ORF Transcript_26706/g.56110 Transcript_26706/m.56110 type:complete len:196 (-) Transcript_26706:659-1246(-)